MSVLAHKRLITPEEFECLPDADEFELIDGRLKEKGAGTESGSIVSRIAHFLSAVVLPTRLGEVITGGDAMYRCFPKHPNRIRKPDASFILRDRLPNGRVPQGIAMFRPDIAIEVISPRDNYYAVDDKIADYFDAKIPLIWIVSPKTHTVLVYGPNRSVQRLCETDDLIAEPIIPGFRVRVADLFPNPLGDESKDLDSGEEE